jgi:hypothetical protein
MAIAQKTGTSVCEELPHLRSKKVMNPQRKQRDQLLKLRCLKGIGHLCIQCIQLQFFHANIHDAGDIKGSKISVHAPA